MSSLLMPIDIYCERLEAGLLAEPLNAVTNMAFIVAAYLLLKQAKANQVSAKSIYLLIVLIALIGIGSGLFHTFANKLTLLMDVIPITIFLLSYIWVFAEQVGRLGYLARTLLLGLFLLLSGLMGYVPQSLALNGTISYLPALVFLLGMGVVVKRKQMLHSAKYLSFAALAFMFSMTMRSVDMMLCDIIPLGTHFIWHLSNSIVLYMVTMALIKADRQTSRSA